MRVPVGPPLEMDSGRGPEMPASKLIAIRRKSANDFAQKI